MVENIVTKPLGLVLIVTVHMVFNGPSKAETTNMTGILSCNVTLNFTFSDTAIDHKSHLAVYVNGEKKIAECKDCTESNVLKVDPDKNSALYLIKNLKQNDSETYWVTVFSDQNSVRFSNKVKLDVREENKNCTAPTVPPTPSSKTNDDNGSSTLISIIILVVLSVVFLATIVLLLIWCLVRTEDKQPPPRQPCIPTLQETVESRSVPPPSVIYSVLDFPKRPSAVLEISPSDIEYAAVSYLPEKRIV